MLNLKFSNTYGDTNILCCPNCEHDYMHQIETRTIFRHEDSDGLMVISNEDGIITKIISSKEIEKMEGGRRDVIYIDFACEQCSYDFSETHKDDVPPKITQIYTLMIKQHKGQTQIEWII
jgi:hypothetical protein